MKTEAWPRDRRAELAKLENLLHDASSINNGSHCLERIERCIRAASELTRSDLSTGRESFMRFLIAQAAGEGA